LGNASLHQRHDAAILGAQRYDILLEKACLEGKESIDDVGDKEFRKLNKTDPPKLAKRLPDIGRRVAHEQVKESHLVSFL
jgi:hypothetical protein